MDDIEQNASPQKLAELLGRLAATGLSAIAGLTVHPDLANSKIYSAYIEPALLGLPERDYYLDEDEKAIVIREKYERYITFVLEESGVSITDAKAAAKEILELETALAKYTLSKEDRRQMDKLYNPFSYEDLQQKFTFGWNDFFNGMNISIPASVIVTDVDYFLHLDDTLNACSPHTLKHYLQFMVVHQAAPFSHDQLEEAHFDLFFRTLEGIEIMKPRSERVVKVVNTLLGEALGQLYVNAHFPPQAKETALEMVDDIVTAFGNRISKLEWMSEATKSYALEKLHAFKVKIGYPDKWKDYAGLQIKSSEEGSSYLENIIAAAIWKFDDEAKRIGKEVDREEWFMAPQVVNAYYNPLFNEIVFPAAILQPPFFDWHADAAVNYGGIGAVIGHEITHGFDDQGSRFDKEGNYNEWWSEEDRENFQSLTKQLVEQFDQYHPFDDLSLNGTFTLGENIADLGGLSVAYDALQLYFKRHGEPEKINGFTPLQRFFMSWATVWRTKIRPEALRNQIKTDPHPPGMYRAVAAPSNLPAFYKAFNIKEGSRWFRREEERIAIW
jgi:predicted metalloendopeptidase